MELSAPYLLANGVLNNKLGITDQDELDRQEANLVAFRQAILDQRGVHGPFTLETLKAIHRFLFQDVYERAGTPRTTPLAKRPYDEPDSPPVMFVQPHLIEARATRIFSALAGARFLTGLSGPDFARAAAELFVSLNNLHPFREGNGRTQRIFIRELAAEAGHDLAFDVVTKERMISMSVAGAAGNRRNFHMIP